MAWDFIPVINPTSTSATDYSDWDFINQFPEAIRERASYIAGKYVWPPTNDIKFSGTVAGPIVDNGDGTITFSLADANPIPTHVPPYADDCTWWNGSQPPGCTGCWWVGISCPNAPYVPSTHDVMIDANGTVDATNHQLYSPARCPIRGQIISHTNSTITCHNDAVNHITAGTISALNDLIGRRFHIIKSGGFWWSDRALFNDGNGKGRWIEWPNDEESWVGDVTTGKIYDIGSPDQGYILSNTNVVDNSNTNWTDNSWVAANDAHGWTYECLVWTGGYTGTLKRLVITGNDKNRLYFGGWTPPELDADGNPINSDGTPYVEPSLKYSLGGRFTIVKQGNIGFPERKSGWHSWWYGGVHTGEYSVGAGAGSGSGGTYSHSDNDDDAPWNIKFTRDFAETGITYQFSDTDPATLTPPLDCSSPELTVSLSTLDVDATVAYDNFCDPADWIYSPHLYKTIRGWQSAIQGMISSFVEPKDYTGSKSIPAYTIAKCFYDCGINAGTTTASSSVSGPDAKYYFTVPSQYWQTTIYFTVLNKTDDSNLMVSSATPDSMGRIYTAVDDTPHTYQSTTVYWTAGWSRRQPLEFRFLYDSYFWIPDASVGIDGSSAIDPPAVQDFCCLTQDPPPMECCRDSTGVGYWTYRTKSTNSKAFSDYGYANDDANNPNQTNEYPHGEFRNGGLYRYAGNSWTDGVFANNHTYFGLGDEDGSNYEMPYWDHADERTHDQNINNRLLDDLKGTQTAVTSNNDTYGTKVSLTDTTKHWWDNWYDASDDGFNYSVVHMGSAQTGSGSTELITEAGPYNTTDDDSEDCWWDIARFDRYGATYPFQYFILEVDKIEVTTDANGDETNITVTYKMPITNVTNAGSGKASISFATFLNSAGETFSVDVGDAWRIYEPRYNLNRFKDCRVRLTLPDGSEKFKTIIYNDDNTIWWDASQAETDAIPEGTLYTIIQYQTGGVWRYTTTNPDPTNKGRDADGKLLVYQKMGSGWFVQPTGADRGSTLHQNMNENEPWITKKFGLACKGDFVWDDGVAAGTGIFTEMYKVLNRLWQTRLSATWVDGYERQGSMGTDHECPACLSNGGCDSSTVMSVARAWEIANKSDCSEELCCGGFPTDGCGAYWYWAQDGAKTSVGDGTAPYALSHNGYSSETGVSDDGCFGACADFEAQDFNSVSVQLYSVWAKGRMTKPTLLKATVDFYNYATFDTTDGTASYTNTTTVSPYCWQDGTNPDFGGTGTIPLDQTNDVVEQFASGGNPVGFKVWTNWKTVDANRDATVTTPTTLGSDTLPPASPTPTFNTVGTGDYQTGWTVTDQCAICKWQLKYLD